MVKFTVKMVQNRGNVTIVSKCKLPCRLNMFHKFVTISCIAAKASGEGGISSISSPVVVKAFVLIMQLFLLNTK